MQKLNLEIVDIPATQIKNSDKTVRGVEVERQQGEFSQTSSWFWRNILPPMVDLNQLF